MDTTNKGRGGRPRKMTGAMRPDTHRVTVGPYDARRKVWPLLVQRIAPKGVRSNPVKEAGILTGAALGELAQTVRRAYRAGTPARNLRKR